MIVDVPKVIDALGIVVERRIRNELWALCPLPDHEDKKPSWSIHDDPSSRRHGRHHCFSCQGGGTIFDLVQAMLGVDERTAREWLKSGGHTSLEPPPEDLEVVQVNPLDEQGRGFSLPAGVMFKPLEQWPSMARRYVTERAIPADQIARWGIGFGAYGRCIGRIVIPVYDELGTLVSYQARSFDGRPGPKYLTPKREENPGAWPLFGAHRWTAERELLVLAEGCFKALACERAGAVDIGAICGSNLSREHVLALQSFKEVLLVKDPDAAGDGIVEQVIATFARHRQLRVVESPKGFDADSMPLDDLRVLLWGTHA